MANTPYDDVFRTLLNDCSFLVLPMLNEVFGEHYTGKEEITFFPNEHFINQQEGTEEKRITDTFFAVSGVKRKNTTGNVKVKLIKVYWQDFLNMMHRLHLIAVVWKSQIKWQSI